MGPAANQAKLSVVQFPLEMLRPLLARLCRARTWPGGSPPNWPPPGAASAGGNDVKADLNIAGFALATPALQTDVLQLAT